MKILNIKWWDKFTYPRIIKHVTTKVPPIEPAKSSQQPSNSRDSIIQIEVK
jgi:hypothetical protein